MSNIPRFSLAKRVQRALDSFPVVLLLGPRQCGKTTLAKSIGLSQGATYFDIEDPECPLRSDSAGLTLRPLTGLVIIDEFQRMPQLFELVRVLADRKPLPARFLILGSASPELVKGVSESMAGRVAYVPMSGFDLAEAGSTEWRSLWIRGRFPKSFLAPTEEQSFEWRQNFVQSFLERDLAQLGIRTPAAAMRRFWVMLSHWQGQTWNASELARALGTKSSSSQQYLDTLCGAFMVRQLPPWFENVGKRIVKAPKIYIRDTGLLHAILGLRSAEQVIGHPRFGFSWEGFAIEEVLGRLNAERDAYFYKTHGGAELDLFLTRGGKRYGFEFKYQDAPRVTRSMRVVLEDLKLDRLFLVHPGQLRAALDERIESVPLGDIDTLGID